jgi:Domain of unknown function (DUF4166)
MERTLYRTLLGPEFERLPPAIRDMHAHAPRAHGRADITRGAHPLAQLICTLVRLPKSGRDVTVETIFKPIEGGERWTRVFGGQSFSTDMVIDTGAPHPRLFEKFGPLKFLLKVVATDAGTDLVPEGVSVFGVPLPRALCPEATGRERVKDGRYHFDVVVRFPIAGDVIRYDGLIDPVMDLAAPAAA